MKILLSRRGHRLEENFKMSLARTRRVRIGFIRLGKGVVGTRFIWLRNLKIGGLLRRW